MVAARRALEDRDQSHRSMRLDRVERTKDSPPGYLIEARESMLGLEALDRSRGDQHTERGK